MLWTISVVSMLLVLFVVHPNIIEKPYGASFNILYQSTARIVWSLGLAYIIYSCTTSNGGIVNKFLSLHIFAPLSRLSYSAYLIHMIVIMQFYFTQNHMLSFQESTFVCLSFLLFLSCFVVVVVVVSKTLD